MECVFCGEEIVGESPVLVFDRPMHFVCQAQFEHEFYDVETSEKNAYSCETLSNPVVPVSNT